MLELFRAEPETLDLRALAALSFQKRLYLATGSGLQGSAHLSGSPHDLVAELIRLASIGQVFLRAAGADAHRLLTSVRDHEAKIEDVVIRDLLAGYTAPAPPPGAA